MLIDSRLPKWLKRPWPPNLIGWGFGCCCKPYYYPPKPANIACAYCNPTGIPQTLYATLSNNSNCACAAGLTATLTYDATHSVWSGAVSDTTCGILKVYFKCNGASQPQTGFQLKTNCWIGTTTPCTSDPPTSCWTNPDSMTCSPFNYVAHLQVCTPTFNCNCCSGGGGGGVARYYGITITE